MSDLPTTLVQRQCELHHEAAGGESPWEPAAGTSDSIRAQQERAVELPPSWEHAVAAAVTSERADDESHADFAQRREREVMALFEQLRPVEALACRRRLDAARPADPLVAVMGRFTAARRARLYAVLVTAPRRHRA